MASVYIRKTDYIFLPQSQAITGGWIGSDPVQVLPRGVSPAELGLALQEALASSKNGVELPTDWNELLVPLQRCAGVRSWNELQRAAKLCQVEAIGDLILVMPSFNGGNIGSDRGYHTLQEAGVTLPMSASAEELGQAILSAEANCT